MSINEKKPPLKETVGAQYICFNKMDENNQWTNDFDTEVEKTEVVKTVTVTENSNPSNVYASGRLYDSDTETSKIEIEVSVIAFPDETLAKMRGDLVDEGGLILSGGKRVRPYFAYGKVVKLKGGKVRYDWYPKCKLSENSDSANTKEESFSEQTDTIKITAYPFNDAGDLVAKVSSQVNWPDGLTEEAFFSKPVLTKEDLSSVLVVASSQTTPQTTSYDEEN